MSQFWPSGLDLSDTSTPFDILRGAQEEWAEQSRGLLTLVIQKAEATSGEPMLIVHAKHVASGRTATLFSIVHRTGAPYPAKIQPRDVDLPNFLKRSYYQPGFGELSAMSAMAIGREVTNKWVCDTPTEFRSQLEKVFNLGATKAEILSLVSGSASTPATDDALESDQPTPSDPVAPSSSDAE